MNKILLTLTLLCITASASQAPYHAEEEARFVAAEAATTAVAARATALEAGTLGAASLTFPTNGEIFRSATDDLFEFLSNDEHTSVKILGFEAKDAILQLYSDQGDDNADKYSIEVSASDVMAVKNNGSALLSFSSAGAMTAVGSLTGDGGDSLSGFLNAQVASTTAAITAAQCGSTFVSNSADVMTLPEASTVLGCRLTFVCGTSDDFDINPADGTDAFGPINSVAAGTGAAITPSAGDAIRCTDIGSSIVIEAAGADLWVPVGVANGAITDVN